MDDPWGSPWATDDNPPRLDLPAPPPLVHTPRVTNKATSPWGGAGGQEEEENPWGSINGGAFGSAGPESPGWSRGPGKSPSLRPTRSGTVSRQPSWGSLGQRSEDLEVARPIASLGSLDRDSARSSHDVTATNGHLTPTNESKTNEDDSGRLQDKKQRDILIDNSSDVGGKTTPKYEHGTPGGSLKPAVQTGSRSEPARQVSKVQELVDMYDGIEKKRDEPNEGPIAGPRIKLVGSPAEDTMDGADPVKGARLAKETDLDDHQDAATMSNAEHEEATVGTMQDHACSGDQAKNDASILPGSLEEQNREPEGGIIIEEDQTHNDVQTEALSDTQDTLPTVARTIQETPEDSPFASIKLPSTPFTVDMSQLDLIFPSTSASTVDPEPVPDVIIDDTFASISERKAWYRISRPGPMRQHNLGNDEDYVRLDWRYSETRTGCLKIVRRWMEEDSIAGRVGVGRRIKGMGIGGAGMFGWNSKEPEVGIEELLSKNRVHTRGASVVSQETKSTAPSTASPTLSTFSPTSPTRMSFGWDGAPSSRFPPDIVASKAGDTSKRSSWIVSKTVDDSEPPKRNSWIAPPPVMPSSKDRAFEKTTTTIDAVVANEWASPPHGELKTNGAKADDGDDMGDDDDDWGEMVTSPPLPAEPIVNATKIEDTSVFSSTTDVDKAASPSPFPSAGVEDAFADFETAWGPIQPKGTLTNSESAQGLLGAGDGLDGMGRPTESVEGPTSKSHILGQPAHEGFGLTSVLADLDLEEPGRQQRQDWSAQTAEPENDVDNDKMLFTEPLKTAMVPQNATKPTSVKSPVSIVMPSKVSAPKTRKSLSEDEEVISQQILRDLPDLSYMLR